MKNVEQDDMFQKATVSGNLPLYDVEELNIIVEKLNNKEISLYEFVANVWNKAYLIGCIDGTKKE